MQMIDVMKRLAEIDATNPNVAKPTMSQEKSMGTISNIAGKSTVQESSVAECGPLGMMGGMQPPRMPASFSINGTAETGDEVANMLGQILSLAGMKPVGDTMGMEPGMEPHAEVEIEPEAGHMEPVDDMANMIGIVDKMNGPQGSDEPMDAPGLGDEDESIGGAEEPAQAAHFNDMADDVRDMTDELTSDGAHYDNSPEPKVKDHDYGDDQVTSKPKEPAKKDGGGNPFAEAVETVKTQLLKDYKTYMAEAEESSKARQHYKPEPEKKQGIVSKIAKKVGKAITGPNDDELLDRLRSGKVSKK
jgi:hypothetical protein